MKGEVDRCDFSIFRNQGFAIQMGEASIDTSIQDTSVELGLKQSISVSFGDVISTRNENKISVNSKFGKFYNIARKIYEKQKSERLLDNYGLDNLHTYAPVDGVEISCAPKIWNPKDVVSNLLQATEDNTAALKFIGNSDYKLTKKENKYFVIDENLGENARFMYSKDFPTKIEIWPVEDNIMMAEPEGQKSGAGLLGLCYVPYHFVYDFAYPVVIQVYDSQEMLQFPVVVSIEKNQINPQETEAVPGKDNTLCQYKNSEIAISTYNSKLEPISANISFRCLGMSCDIGETILSGKSAILVDKFPECVNGFVVAKADGYKTTEEMISTNEEISKDIIMKKEYNLSLNVSGLENDFIMISFDSEDDSSTILYPGQKEVKLSEGIYNVSIMSYRNSTINFPATTDKKCVQVPKSGLVGFFGATEEKCYNLDIPSQTVSFALSGGGIQEKYFTDSELEKGKTVLISAMRFKTPTSLQELQDNYLKLETARINVEVK